MPAVRTLHTIRRATRLLSNGSCRRSHRTWEVAIAARLTAQTVAGALAIAAGLASVSALHAPAAAPVTTGAPVAVRGPGHVLGRTPGRAATGPAGRAAGRAVGRIEGTVEISTALSARRPQYRPYSEPGMGSTPPPPPPPSEQIAAELHNVVIYVDGDSTKVPAAAELIEARRHGSMSQRGERFTPHVVPVVIGATVEFPNDDDVYHNVFSLSGAAGPHGFDLGRYPKGASRSITFTRSGTVQVFCHIHSDMSGVVLVLPNPFFASPDDAHHFSIDAVPEGNYTLVGWHDRIKPITRRVRVTAGQTTTVNFNIPLPQGGDR